jgi:hypothetical protein
MIRGALKKQAEIKPIEPVRVMPERENENLNRLRVSVRTIIIGNQSPKAFAFCRTFLFRHGLNRISTGSILK